MARVSIEDCLIHMENRFALVAVAADRARQLMDGASTLVDSRNKEGVTALREIAEGLIEARMPVSETAPHVAPATETTPAT
jgi:DNA-directed RNA polymerase subunit omega